MPKQNEYPFQLSRAERDALSKILAGDPYLRVPGMRMKRNRLIANGMTTIVWASELRLIMNHIPSAVCLLLDATHSEVAG